MNNEFILSGLIVIIGVVISLIMIVLVFKIIELSIHMVREFIKRRKK